MIALGNRRLRPQFWPTLIALCGLAVLLALGTWQVQRLYWKNALIAKLETRTSAAPAPLPAEIVDPEALEFRPVRLAGRFRHEREIYLLGRVPRGRRVSGRSRSSRIVHGNSAPTRSTGIQGCGGARRSFRSSPRTNPSWRIVTRCHPYHRKS